MSLCPYCGEEEGTIEVFVTMFNRRVKAGDYCKQCAFVRFKNDKV